MKLSCRENKQRGILEEPPPSKTNSTPTHPKLRLHDTLHLPFGLSSFKLQVGSSQLRKTSCTHLFQPELHPSVLQSVTIFGSRAVADIISEEELILAWSGSLSNMNVSSQNREIRTQTETPGTQGERQVSTKAEIRVMPLQAKERRSPPASHQKQGERRAVGSPSQPSGEPTLPTGSCTSSHWSCETVDFCCFSCSVMAFCYNHPSSLPSQPHRSALRPSPPHNPALDALILLLLKSSSSFEGQPKTHSSKSSLVNFP